MNTLKGVFGDTKPKYRRNFIQENMKQLREMQGYWRNKEKSADSTTRPMTNKYQNVPSKIAPRVSGSQLGNAERQPSREKTTAVSKSVSRTLGSSSTNPVSHVTQVGITRRSRSPSQKRNNPKKKGNSEKEELGMDEYPSTRDSSPASGAKSNRSLGCQTVDPRNADDLYNEGVIRYPSSRKSPSLKKRQPIKRPPTREMGLQTERTSSPPIKNTAAAGDLPSPVQNYLPDMQKLSLSPHTSDVEEPSEVPETNYLKPNSRSAQSRTRSPNRTTNPLKPPPTYQKGVVPNFAHITELCLISCYADLVQELNMLPVRTDTLRMRNRKMELEKQLNKIEHGIKVFSRPKVFVKIGA
ncbi:hypothetical protein C0J52_01040 [Blattella germanica]|nr:hypothetical protein C0J52_01040 [Blattella germanica]